jgi:3-hydroxyisobutyrate dehydrogenase-like beta-hydroxyacid dehydrogenase
MTIQRATVLGSARAAVPVAEDLHADGVMVSTWLLPDECTAQEAAALAELASADGALGEPLALAEVSLSVFRDAEVLAAIVPYVLPYLSPHALWLHIGNLEEDARCSLSIAAARRGIPFLEARLTRDHESCKKGQTLAIGSRGQVLCAAAGGNEAAWSAVQSHRSLVSPMAKPLGREPNAMNGHREAAERVSTAPRTVAEWWGL